MICHKKVPEGCLVKCCGEEGWWRGGMFDVQFMIKAVGSVMVEEAVEGADGVGRVFQDSQGL